MMKRLITTIVVVGLCFAFNLLKAQGSAGSISGRIKDQKAQPIEGATVSLLRNADSTIVKYELSDQDGKFSFKEVAAGVYRITVTYMATPMYKTEHIPIDAQAVIFPDITLITTSTTLKEVVISSKKPVVEYRADRVVLNVDALISNAGTTALDVLEKSPGVNIEQGGMINFHGKAGVLILIDDKPTYLQGSDLEGYLRSLPSSMLDQIELMTNPPAKYDAAGTAGVINIKTKRNNIKDFNLGVTVGLRLSRYATTNNTMYANYRKNKINLFGTLAYTLMNNFNDVDINRQYYYNAGRLSSSFDQNSYIRRNGKGYRATLGTDFYANDHTTFGLLLSRLSRTSDNTNTSSGQLFNALGQPDSSLKSLNTDHGQFNNTGANLNFKHTFKKNGPALSANLDYLRYTTNNDQLFVNENYNNVQVLSSANQLMGALPMQIDIYAAKVDYSMPLVGNWKFESGAKSSFTNTDNQASYYDLIGREAVPDNDKTNHFLYKEGIHAAYVNFNKDFKRFNVQAGLRVENTDSRGHQLGNAQKADSSFNRSYTSLFPTFYLLYKLDTMANHQLKITYGQRIERPYYQDLNPFITPLDKYTFYIGNPYLLPSYSRNIEFGYVYKNKINVTLIYTDIRDRVTETIEIRDGYYYDRPGNIGSTKMYDLNLDAAFDPAAWFSWQFSADVWYIQSKSDFYGSILNNHGTSFSAQSSLQFKLKKGWSLQADGKYQSKQSDAQFLLAARGRLNLAAAKVLSPKATLKLSVSDLLYTNINKGVIGNLYQTTAGFRTLTDSRAALLTLSMRIGKTGEQRRNNQTGAGEEQGRVKN